MTLLFALALFLQTPAAPACGDLADCRTQAEAAAARGDFETFHDLAWRTIQKGRRNDTDLMFLLARAQSLSGRPDDALVMLQRIVDLGGKPDVAANPDFARVRELARWPELAARLGIPTDGSAGGAPPAADAPPTPAGKPADASAAVKPGEAMPATPGRSAGASPRGARTPGDALSATEGRPASSAPASGGKPETPLSTAPAGAPASAASEPAFTFEAPDGLAPIALGHDAVSRRFLLADRVGAQLVIIDEVSHHVVHYASAATAGFYGDLTGFAIDARRGDLWVVSAKGSGDAAASALHKLQLVSGRTLMRVTLPDSIGPVKLAAVAVTPDGTVYAIDAVDPRLLRVRAGSRELEVVARLDVTNPTALTAPDDRLLYVASDEGLSRVDLTSNKTTRVKSVEKLTQFASLAWRNGALLGVERVADSYLVVRVALDASGLRAQPRAILAASSDRIVGTLTPDGYFYLAGGSIRLVKLR